MIGDLGSQVEQTGSVEQRRLPSLNSGDAVSGKSSEVKALVDMGFVYGQPVNGNSSRTNDETLRESNPNLYGNSNIPQVYEVPNSLLGAVGADKDGHLVVKDRFWSVFCKEVSLKPAKHPSLLDQMDVTLAPQVILN